MADSRTTESYVITWFPHDRPERHVSKRTLEDAHAYIEDNDLMGAAPLIERVLTTVSEERHMVWNSTGVSL